MKFLYILFYLAQQVKLRKELGKFFSMHGYETEEITDYEHMEEEILKARGQLLLLDMNLPFLDGKYLCSQLRKKTSLPVIIMTSQNTEMDELLSMNCGADDFIPKPFNPQILLAHVEAVLKRAYGKPQEGEEVDCGSFLLNVSKGVVQSQGKEIELTKNENRILYCLGKNRGKVVSRDDLINDLWDSELFVDDNTLTVNMTRLRGKLEELGISQVIHTKRGQGYWLE